MAEDNNRVVGWAVNVCYRICLRDWIGALGVGDIGSLKVDRSQQVEALSHYGLSLP